MNYDRLLDMLFSAMIEWFAGDPKRVQHFVKVHSFARLIGMNENLGVEELFTLEAAAYVHDIGIKPGEELYSHNDGKIQEQLGPECAEKMLCSLGFPEKTTERVSYLVGRHHTYNNITDTDCRILIEADFLVNLYEDNASEAAIKSAYDKIFATPTGRRICRTMFSLTERKL
ncbi:MAG: HD domain-containing protein [Ruminococcus sp.]|nr:HD domain-containing protein [Ruminococcus sp.]